MIYIYIYRRDGKDRREKRSMYTQSICTAYHLALIRSVGVSAARLYMLRVPSIVRSLLGSQCPVQHDEVPQVSALYVLYCPPSPPCSLHFRVIKQVYLELGITAQQVGLARLSYGVSPGGKVPTGARRGVSIHIYSTYVEFICHQNNFFCNSPTYLLYSRNFLPSIPLVVCAHILFYLLHTYWRVSWFKTLNQLEWKFYLCRYIYRHYCTVLVHNNVLPTQSCQLVLFG